jgi:hypothetical protein
MGHRVGHSVERLARYDLSRLAADLDNTADPAHVGAKLTALAWGFDARPVRIPEFGA